MDSDSFLNERHVDSIKEDNKTNGETIHNLSDIKSKATSERRGHYFQPRKCW